MGIARYCKLIFPIRRVLRMAFLALLVLALTGPWTYETIHVPAPHRCDEPYVRLDDDFCGTPFSVAAYYPMVGGELATFLGRLVQGEPAAASVGFLSVMVLLVLPFFSALLLVLRKGGRNLGIFHKTVLFLALMVVLFFFVPERSAFPEVLWGPWLYLALNAGLLALEVKVFRADRGQVVE